MIAVQTLELPSELVYRILSYFTFHPDPARSPLYVQMDKRQLGHCSLVCQFWAQWCRPHIFHTITLRTAGEWTELVDLMNAPSVVSPTIRQCLTKLRIAFQGVYQAPWLHLVTKEWEHLVDVEMQNVHMSAPEPEGAREYAPHSMSAGLPRTLPAGTFPVTSLRLSDLRFRRIADVVNLVKNLRDFVLLECTRLAFDDEAPAPPPSGSRRIYGQSFKAVVSQSATPEVDVRLMVAAASFSFTGTIYLMLPRALGAEGWAIVHDTLLMLRPLAYTQLVREQPSGQQLTFAYQNGPQQRLLELKFKWSRAARDALGSIDSLSIHISKHLNAEEVTQLNWDAFDSRLIQPGLAGIALEITTDSPTVFKWLLDVIPGRTVLSRKQNSRQPALVKFRSYTPRGTLSFTLDEIIRTTTKTFGRCDPGRAAGVFEFMHDVCRDASKDRALYASVMEGCETVSRNVKAVTVSEDDGESWKEMLGGVLGFEKR